MYLFSNHLFFTYYNYCYRFWGYNVKKAMLYYSNTALLHIGYHFKESNRYFIIPNAIVVDVKIQFCCFFVLVFLNYPMCSIPQILLSIRTYQSSNRIVKVCVGQHSHQCTWDFLSSVAFDIGFSWK